ncbi:MAG: hypothetical protein LQ349_009020 [Xanthoria aureola]|nr:MAG: hypothetical protein LQ349_009020 [Xanthoria aureola]
MPFPILHLPLELRNMIYRYAVLSHDDEIEVKGGFIWASKIDDEAEANASRRSDAANLLLTNKQLSFEASTILSEERYYQNDIVWGTFYAPNIKAAYDEIPLRCSSPFELYPKIRNIDIIVPQLRPVRLSSIGHSHTCHGCEQREVEISHACDDRYTKLTGVVCNDLASCSPRLRNVVVHLPCECTTWDFALFGQVRASSDSQRCFPAERLERALAPIRRLRVRRLRFIHKCQSPTVVAEILPILQDLIATVQSSNPVAPLSKDERVWYDARLEARQKGLEQRCQWDLDRAQLNMSSWFTDSRLLDCWGKEFRPQCQDNLQELRVILDAGTWNEDLMSSVAGPLLSELI